MCKQLMVFQRYLHPDMKEKMFVFNFRKAQFSQIFTKHPFLCPDILFKLNTNFMKSNKAYTT